MTLGEVIKNTFVEYKENFGSASSLVFLFYALPYLIVNLVGFGFGGYDYYVNGSAALGTGAQWAMLVLRVVAFLVGLLAYVSLISGAVSRGLFGFYDALKIGKRNYWRAFGIGLIVAVMLMLPIGLTVLLNQFITSSWVLLVLILLIPALIISVYWSLAVFALADKDGSIFDSLQGSAQAVRGNWWRTLGYYVVLAVISTLIVVVIQVVLYLLMLLLNYALANYLDAFLITGIGLNLLADIVGYIIVVPISIFFLKNYYSALK